MRRQRGSLPSQVTPCRGPSLSRPVPSRSTGLITSAYSVSLNPPDSFLEGVARTGRYTFTAGE